MMLLATTRTVVLFSLDPSVTLHAKIPVVDGDAGAGAGRAGRDTLGGAALARNQQVELAAITDCLPDVCWVRAAERPAGAVNSEAVSTAKIRQEEPWHPLADGRASARFVVVYRNVMSMYTVAFRPDSPSDDDGVGGPE